MDTKKIEEKLKYLMLMDLREQRFELMFFLIEFDINKDNKIEFYEVYLRFDYQGVIDADWYEFTRDVRNMFDKIEDSLNKFPINPQGELDLNYQSFSVSGPMIWDLDYSYDTKHIFHCSFRVNHDE